MGWQMAGDNVTSTEDVTGGGSAPTPAPKPQKPEKPKKKRHGCLIFLLVMVGLIVAMGAIGAMHNKALEEERANRTYEWPSSGLAAMLPKPTSDKGDLHSYDSELSVTVRQYSQDDFEAYVEACQGKGFTEDAEENSTSYSAYNKDGYDLDLDYSSSSQELRIELNKPRTMSTITWPSSGLAALVPTPASTRGVISTNDAKEFSAYIGDTTKDDFKAYADSCLEAGFNVDYKQSDTSFTGSNAEGAELSVKYGRYVGYQTMQITITAPEQTSAPATTSIATDPAAATTDSTASSSSDTATDSDSSVGSQVLGALGSAASSLVEGAVTPEFKEMMDGYEAFMNDYCDFMERYENASESESAAMLADATALLQQEAEWVDKVNAVGEDSLSAADTAYYLAVTARVSQRLLEVAE